MSYDLKMQQHNISTKEPNTCKTIGAIFLSVTLFTGIQYFWTTHFISVKVGLINLLPTFIFLLAWLSFAKVTFPKPLWQWLVFFIGFVLTLRLPITLNRSLEIINWLAYIGVIISLSIPISKYFISYKKRAIILLITTVLVLFNSYSHLWLNSPFSYSFRLINNLESNYTPRQDNNSTWECSYENLDIPVHCDMRHFIAPEKIFSIDNYDGSFSVFLRRFFYGYLSSLIGYEGNRWFASFSLNIFFWLAGCMALHRMATLFRLQEDIAAIGMLSMACSWGFVSFVSQPAPYLAAYAFATIAPWATLEILEENHTIKNILLATIVISGLLVYDIYPITLTCIIMLLCFGRANLSWQLLTVQALAIFLWWKVSLSQFLGTTGNLRNTQVISNSFSAWANAIFKLDFPLLITYFVKGSESLLISGLGIGMPCLIIFIFYLFFLQDNYQSIIWDLTNNQERRQYRNKLLVFCCSLGGLMFLAGLLFTPEAIYWSPGTSMIPRFLYYSFSANTIAIVALGYLLAKQWIYVIPVVTLFFASIDFWGIASMSILFDYGDMRLVWK